MSGDNAKKLALMEKGLKDENSDISALNMVLRLVVCQGNMLSVKCEFAVAEIFCVHAYEAEC